MPAPWGGPFSLTLVLPVKSYAPVQLSLGVSLKDDATFANYFQNTPANAQALQALLQLSQGAGDAYLAIWGARGCGLTHLLQAVCHAAYLRDQSVQYLPLRDLVGYAAEDVCEGLEACQLVCLDGLDEICGNRAWEQALFHLFNRLQAAGSYLLVASHTSLPAIPILLPDLKSRLLSGVSYHIESLNDAGKEQALMVRAKGRGMELSAEVARFILTRATRDTNELFNLLNRLDDASLQHQRKLTIPFIKDVLFATQEEDADAGY
jgi:DnaA-homolog protein